MDIFGTVTMSDVVVNSGIIGAPGPVCMRACVRSSTEEGLVVSSLDVFPVSYSALSWTDQHC